MTTTRHMLKRLLPAALLLFSAHCLQAQVTIGSVIKPRRAALLDLKTQQGTANITTVADPDNVTSDKGGLLLPRVSLTDIFKLDPLMNDADVAAEEATDPGFKLRLAGLTVYNINDNTVAMNPNPPTLYPAIYTWNGMGWVTSQLNTAVSSIVSQPTKFTFYETGTEFGAVKQLKFEVSGPGTWTYQWYQITGSNMHVRIGKPVGEPGTIYSSTADANALSIGANTDSFTPEAVLKHFTHTYAANNGFYRFYCIAQNDRNEELISDIAEVAVGCGAKTNTGEWFSFMCFNLGADSLTIKGQRDAPFTPNPNLHTYSPLPNPNEQDIYGSLFQWGRIADNHELRASTSAAAPVTLGDIVSGSLCSAYNPRPYQQIATTSSWYGKFIYGAENWTPVDQSISDVLWRNGAFLANDPCTHYDLTLAYHEFWYIGSDNPSPGDPNTAACGESNLGWRTPSQEEWGELFRGGTQPGSPATATANTWEWTSANGGGYEIKPDGVTTTLFLPASGIRSIASSDNGQFYNQGKEGAYWSVRINGTLSYSLNFDEYNVNPATGSYRANAFALRCIKN